MGNNDGVIDIIFPALALVVSLAGLYVSYKSKKNSDHANKLAKEANQLSNNANEQLIQQARETNELSDRANKLTLLVNSKQWDQGVGSRLLS